MKTEYQYWLKKAQAKGWTVPTNNALPEHSWIAYLDTHPLPVDGWTIVDIKLRDGTVRMKQIAGQLSWPWGKTGRDIIAYRIHKEK